MFESNQSDLQDSGQGAAKSRPQMSDSSFYETHEEETHHFPAEEDEPKRLQFPFLLVGFGALAVVVVLLLFATKPKKANELLPGDLGQGIVAESGLRGHLLTQWDGNAKSGRVQYQLRLEPVGPVQAPGFAHVTANPAAPLSVNIRVLDQSGFALCGKEVLFRFDPSKAVTAVPANAHGKKVDAKAIQAAKQAELDRMQAEEADRERGKDIFQNQAGEDGVVTAANAQGTLPCSADQYKRAYYWDFTTNFPTVTEQTALLDPHAGKAKPTRPKSPAAMAAHRMSVALSKAKSDFFIQGDDRVTGFDPAHGVLDGTAGRSFVVTNRPERTIAANWARSYSLIHYKCDQHATCALTSAGGSSVINARMNE